MNKGAHQYVESSTEARDATLILYGRFSAEIEATARSLNVLPELVANGLAELLHRPEGGSILRPSVPVRTVRRIAAEASEILQPEVEVAVRPQRGRPQGSRNHKSAKTTGSPRTTWWTKLSKKQKAEVIAKRIASAAKTLAAKKAA